MRLVQSTAVSVPVYLVSSATGDGLTGVDATMTVTISKDGGAFAAASDGTITEIGDGWYDVALNATDTATAGYLIIQASDASAASEWHDYHEVEAAYPTTGLDLSDAAKREIAESVLRENFDSARSEAGGHVDTLSQYSVLGALSWFANGWSLSGSTITVKDEAGTSFYTVTVTTTGDSTNPIIGMAPTA